MTTATLAELEAAATIVHAVLPPTPQYAWPLLSARAGCEVWVKHENHMPVGAFKVRGGLVYMDWLRRERPDVMGVITATRGNHGQSVAFAATRNGLKATIVVPEGNSVEKNAAMQALGGELVVHGHDFQAAYEFTLAKAEAEGLHLLPSFAPPLVAGVGTYGLELLRAVPDLDTIYAPIGLGSGICGLISARDALNLDTRIVGVVAEGAPAYALSFRQGSPVSTNRADTMADGMACRVPVPAAVATIVAGADRIVIVSDDEIEAAMRHYYTDTHNLAEGAGAAPLAALLQEKDRMRDKRVAVILSGGNVDMSTFGGVLGGAPPAGR